MELSLDLKSRQEVRDLVEKADNAGKILSKMSQEQIDAIVKAVAEAGEKHAAELGKMAVEETGFGNPQDKAQKNIFASKHVYEAVKSMKTTGILRKDEEKKVWDVGVPVGVIAAIAPSTNPTSTVFYKAIIALKGGNTIVFSPHPGAKTCTLRAVELLMAAAKTAGCPDGAVGCITTPTMDAINEIMRHPKVRLILATGGGAMVRAAYSSGKPAIGVGAGNGPAYLHPSCDLDKSLDDIFQSKTFDNGTICASEQSIIYEASMEGRVKDALKKRGGHLLTKEESDKLSKIILRPNGTMNPKIVGKSAAEIAKMAGLTGDALQAKILLSEGDQVGVQNPYSGEKLCPILALFRVENEERALALACEILHFEGSGHTFVIHAKDESVIEKFSLQVPVSRFLVNTPAALGGIGFSTNLFPALTLGCGAVGGSSSSNNIGPLDLINIRRVAWGVKDVGRKQEAQDVPYDDALVAAITARLMEKIKIRSEG